jgi:hypothetical protein
MIQYLTFVPQNQLDLNLQQGCLPYMPCSDVIKFTHNTKKQYSICQSDSLNISVRTIDVLK